MNGDVNLTKLANDFHGEDSAREFLERLRWPDGPVCPHCRSREAYRLTPKADSKRPVRKGVLKCKACRKQFTVTVGTIFEDSHISLSKWLLAIHLLCSSKKGISTHQIHRMLGVSYKSAWFMTHRIRYAMSQPPLADKLKGIVEADETYVGGRGGPPGRSTAKKTPVFALVERGGRVRSFKVDRVTPSNLGKIIADNVRRDAQLMTDALVVYRRIGRDFAGHEWVRHERGEYVRGAAHVNTAEGFFSILKRGINGSYHWVSRKHLPRYLAEFEFRYNARKVNDGERAALAILAAEGKRLTYREPTGAKGLTGTII